MAKEEGQQKMKMIVTVLLSNGNEVKHAYDDPSVKEIIETKRTVFTALSRNQLGRDEPCPLAFDNPEIVYNPDNVSGIRFDLVE